MDPCLQATEQLGFLIAMDVKKALQSSLVVMTADLLFRERPSDFRAHPANTFQYAAVAALAERSLVAIYEQVQATAKVPPDLVALWAALQPHRHGAGQPATTDWGHQSMNELVASDRQDIESTAALIWTGQQAMNARLKPAGLAVHNDTLEVIPPMGEMLRDVLRHSMVAEAQPTVMAMDWMEALLMFRDRFVLQVSKAA